jgi:hypothetical protein
MDAIAGGVAGSITAAVRQQLQQLPSTECRGASAKEQGRGVPHSTATTTGVRNPETALTPMKNRNFCTFLLGIVLMISWNLNDCFRRDEDRKMILGSYEDTMCAAMHVFLEAIEMGNLVQRFPRASFAIGACAETWKVDDSYEFFANVARLWVVLTGRIVASGVHDRASIEGLLFRGDWRYAKGAEDKAATAITAWMVRDTNYAFVIAIGLHTHPRNYADAEMGVALVAADTQGDRLMSRDARGLGAVDADINPSRWGASHNSVLPPEPWCWRRIYDTIDGKPIDVPAEVPWSCIEGVECDPDTMVHHYVGPAF